MSTENQGNEGNGNEGEGQGQDQGAENQGQQGNDDAGRAGSDERLKADLAAERKARQTEAAARKSLEKKLEQLEAATKSDTEKAIDNARKEGATEALTKANKAIVKMAIRAAAADKFADPTDADMIDPSQFDVDDDGNVDTKAINAEIARLLKEKPHWAKQEKKAGSVDQGARGGSAAKSTDMNDVIRKQAGY